MRDNTGYDTAAFREGILSLGKETLQHCSQLMLVNDTNIGPMSDLAAVFPNYGWPKSWFLGNFLWWDSGRYITGFNRYGYIPNHLQSYFLVIEPLLLQSEEFYDYWEVLTDTDSREEAIESMKRLYQVLCDLGYRYDALVHEKPGFGYVYSSIRMLKAGSPLIKYTSLKNYDDQQFLWQGLEESRKFLIYWTTFGRRQIIQ